MIMVAGGAGQKFFQRNYTELDKSDNVKLKNIGILLKDTFFSIAARPPEPRQKSAPRGHVKTSAQKTLAPRSEG